MNHIQSRKRQGCFLGRRLIHKEQKMKKSSICRIIRTVVLAVVLSILQCNYDIGLGGSLLVVLSSFTWGLCEFVDTGLK